jgi:hypothetical protein
MDEAASDLGSPSEAAQLPANRGRREIIQEE